MDSFALVTVFSGLPFRGFSNILILIVALVILWIIVSIPVWAAAKAITGGRAGFGSAMAATLLGPVVYGLVIVFVTFFLSHLLGASAGVWAIILAFIAWIGIYKSVFSTGWLGALGIAILAAVIFLLLSLLLGPLMGLAPISLSFFAIVDSFDNYSLPR